MNRYIRDKFLFQTQRDKQEKIKPQLLDLEFYNFSNYIDSVIKYINSIEGGNFVGKVGYANFLFKNKGNAVVLEPIENVSLQYTFSNFRNSFFIYNSNYQPNVYSFNITNVSNQILKYYNNNFLFDTIKTEDFTLDSIIGYQKIRAGSIDTSKINGFDTFFENQTKFLYREGQIQIIKTYSPAYLEEQMDVSTNLYLTPQKFSNYLDTNTLLGRWFDYIKKNKFSVQKKIEPYITLTASSLDNYNKLEFGIGLLGGTGCPVNTISSKSVTNINIYYYGTYANPADSKAVICGAYVDNSGQLKRHDYAQPISPLFWYFHKMFWGDRQITKRLFWKRPSLFYNKDLGRWYFRDEGIRSTDFIIKKFGAYNYKVIHNYHVADGCFEPRHFCDNSISLNSIAKKNGQKIPITKFNRAFLTRLGL